MVVAWPANKPDPLAAVAHAIRILAEHGGQDGAVVGEALQTWLAGNQSLEAALGGGGGMRSARRRAQRAAMLHELRARYYPTLKGRTLVHDVAVDGGRYEAGAWLRHRKSLHRPDGRDGLFFDVLWCCDEFPSEASLRIIFNGVVG
jgi:hypothetical protein